MMKSKFSLERRRTMEEEIENEIQEAFRFAEESPFPDAVEAYEDLYRD